MLTSGTNIFQGLTDGLNNVVSTGLQGLGAILNGSATSGFSDSTSQNSSSNVGGSQSTSSMYGYSDANAESYSYANSDASSQSSGYSDSTTFGREASAEDIKRAYEANQLQKKLWEEQAKYNASEAEKDRAFQAYMSNTSYQRAVADLIKAGLNPILAAGNMGASTPGGAMASSGLATAQKATTYAEQRSHSENKSSSSSKSRSESESSSKSHSEEKAESQSSSYQQGYSQGSSEAHSETSNNMKDFIGSLNGLLNGGSSGKSQGGGGHFNGHGATR